MVNGWTKRLLGSMVTGLVLAGGVVALGGCAGSGPAGAGGSADSASASDPGGSAEAGSQSRGDRRTALRVPSGLRESAVGRDDALRGVWVTRWDFRTPADVRTIVRNAGQAGFTDLFWQVRGQADAYYDSDLEPWGELLFRTSNDDTLPPSAAEVRRGPGFDPLEIAVREAHRRGMRLHAWINVMPLWKGTTPPVSNAHPYLSRTAWRLKDDAGDDQPLGEQYVIANPVLDSVHDHLAAVTRDIATRYDIDGVHLDYIRFVSESLEKGKHYPGDAVSRALFLQARGLAGGRADDQAVGASEMRGWVRERITDLVRRLRDEAVSARPGVMMSAAVWRHPDRAREEQLQDAARWVRLGTLDAVMPMIYDTNDAAYRTDLRAWQAAVGRRGGVVPGIGLYKHESGRQTVGQATMHDNPDRFVLFAYSSIFPSAAPGSVETPEADSERLKRRVPLRSILLE